MCYGYQFRVRRSVDYFLFLNEIDRLKPPTWTNPVRSTKVLGVLKGGLLGGRDSHICNLAFLKFKMGFPWVFPQVTDDRHTEAPEASRTSDRGTPSCGDMECAKNPWGQWRTHTDTQFTSIYIDLYIYVILISFSLYLSLLFLWIERWCSADSDHVVSSDNVVTIVVIILNVT